MNVVIYRGAVILWPHARFCRAGDLRGAGSRARSLPPHHSGFPQPMPFVFVLLMLMQSSMADAHSLTHAPPRVKLETDALMHELIGLTSEVNSLSTIASFGASCLQNV
jgi:hypothetical protein